MFSRFIIYFFFLSFILSCNTETDFNKPKIPNQKSLKPKNLQKPICEDCVANQNALLDSIAFYSDSLKKTNNNQLSLKLFNSVEKLNSFFLSKCADCEDVDKSKLAKKLTQVYDVVHDVKLQKSIEKEILQVNN